MWLPFATIAVILISPLPSKSAVPATSPVNAIALAVARVVAVEALPVVFCVNDVGRIPLAILMFVPVNTAVVPLSRALESILSIFAVAPLPNCQNKSR